MKIKRPKYKYLMFALFMVLNAALYAQNNKALFSAKMNEAADIVYENPERAVSLSFEAHALATKGGDKWSMAMTLSGIGYISYEVGDFKSSYVNYVKALNVIESADTVDLSNKVIILNELSRIQSEFNNHDESIIYGQKAWEHAKEYVKRYPDHAERNGHLSWLVEIPYYMAIEYQAKGAHQTAGEILFKLWEDAENKKDIWAYSQVLNELGIIKMNNGEYLAAQEYLGLIVSAADIDDWDKSIAYHNLAGSYMGLGEYEKAENFYLIALDIKRNLDDPEAIFTTLLDIGELEFRKGNPQKSIDYWEQALMTYSDIQLDPELYSIYNWLQRAYMDVDVEKAKEYNLKYTALNDFYVKNQTEQRELEAQNRQELSTWIDQQRQERVDAEQRQRFVQQFWPLFVGVALIVLFSIFLGIRYYRTVRTNKLLTRQQMGFQRVSTRDKAA